MNSDKSDKRYTIQDSPETCWLTPQCEADADEGRQWCENRPEDCPECGSPAIKYVRADLLEALASERDDFVFQLAHARGEHHNDDLQAIMAANNQVMAERCQLAAKLAETERVLRVVKAERDLAVSEMIEACHVRDFANAEIARLREANEWWPIKSANPPRHETVEFLCSNSDVYQGRPCYGMHEPYWCGHSELNFGVVLADKGLIVTHWRLRRPLPPPPQETTK
jgi:hypothetical protein